MIYSFKDIIPVVHPSAFVHPQASVIGHVTIGKDVYVGPGAAIRGDFGEILIEDGCNVQENCIVHMFPGVRVVLEEGSHVGHGAIVHGANLGRNCLIGMNAVIMDNVRIGNECIVGALAFVPADTQWDDRQVIVGNPAKAVKQVSDEMITWKSAGTAIYQALPAELHASLKEVEALREIPADRPTFTGDYPSWDELKKR